MNINRRKIKAPNNPKNQLKNFAPVAFRSISIDWNERERRIIGWIAKRYKFSIDFDLHSHLSRIDTDIKTFKELERQSPSHKETTHSLKIIKKQVRNTQAVIKGVLKLLSIGSKDELASLLNMLNNTGSKHRALIAENSLGEYETLHELCRFLKLLVEDNLLPSLALMLERVITGIEVAEAKLPAPKRGRKACNLEKGLIHKLLYIYTNGTSHKATCYFDPINERYCGDFYFFLLATLSLLLKKIAIKSLKPETWGDYSREVIRYHYKDKEG